jgi:hypothetical protein
MSPIAVLSAYSVAPLVLDIYPFVNVQISCVTGHRTGVTAVVVVDIQLGKVVQVFPAVQMMVNDPPTFLYPSAH